MVDWNFALIRTRAGLCQIFGLDQQALGIYRQLLAVYQDAPCARVAGLLAAKANKLDEAESWYAKAAEWEPTDIETWFNLGYVRDARGRKREAIEAFRQAVKLAPHFARAWHAIGSMHIALGEHALAIDPLRKARELDPQNAPLLYQMAQCQHHTDNERGLRDSVKALATLNPAIARKLVDETGRKELERLLSKG